MSGRIVTEFVCPRPKLYSSPDVAEAKRANEIQRAAMADVRDAELFTNSTEQPRVRLMCGLSNKCYKVIPVESVKQALCVPWKRCLLPDGVRTTAHWHYAIRREQTRDVDETTPESARSSTQSPGLADDDNGDVTDFITPPYADLVRFGISPRMSHEQALVIVGVVYLRQEIDDLSAISNVP